MLLAEIKNIYHKELGELYPKEEVNSFFYMMIEHYLGLERFVLAVRPDLIISKEEEGPLFAALSDLKVQRPIQHILEKAHFMDLEFAVNENVLIPRPETEELVRWILKDCQAERSRSPYAENVKNSLNKENPSECQKNKDRPISILDIGTGSGCIAISLAKNLPHADVHALDVSPKALEVAKKTLLRTMST